MPTLTWIPVTERLPDDDTTVLIAIGPNETSQLVEVWHGFHDGDDGWRGVDATPCAVTHWAEMPEGPGK